MIVTMVSMMLPVVLTVAFGVLAGWQPQTRTLHSKHRVLLYRGRS